VGRASRTAALHDLDLRASARTKALLGPRASAAPAGGKHRRGRVQKQLATVWGTTEFQRNCSSSHWLETIMCVASVEHGSSPGIRP
jgi:hypothetical protein